MFLQQFDSLQYTSNDWPPDWSTQSPTNQSTASTSTNESGGAWWALVEGGGGHAEILGAAGGSFVLLVAVLRDVTSAREAGSLHLVKLRDGEGEILPAIKCEVNIC